MITSEGFRETSSCPMERTHVKDLVQRNAAETAAYQRLTKHIEHQRRAFVRQNTKDEDEVRLLLQRLQTEQQATQTDDDVAVETTCSDIDGAEPVDLDQPFCSRGHMTTSNPYPVTIVPKYGPRTKDAFQNTATARLLNRRKSVEFEDIQESLTSLSLHSSPSPIQEHPNGRLTRARDDHFNSPLASPDAISSVRRMRKSVTELANRRAQIRTSGAPSSELNKSGVSHSRSNSLKEKSRNNSGNASPRSCVKNKRGGSLKEKRISTVDSPRQLSRSYSVLTRASLSEFNKQQQDHHTVVQSCGRSELDSTTGQRERSGSFKKKAEDSAPTVVRRGSKKLPVSRKTSSDSTYSGDDRSPMLGRYIARKRTSVSSTPDTTPNASPLGKDYSVFTY